MKKLIPIILSLMLLVTLIPLYGPAPTVSADANDYFNFTNESKTKGSARIVTSETVTLSGVLNNVDGLSVSYKVIQVPSTGEDTEDKLATYAQTQNINLGVSVTGNRITVQNIVLFPGMNRIEFTGSNGMMNVPGVVYIEYRDSPMLTNLRYSYSNSSSTIYPVEDQVTMLYRPVGESRPDQLAITGNAPNASKVELIFNGYSYDYQVTSNNNYTFSFGSLPLVSGINEATFKITSGSHEFTTTRQIVLYNNNPVFYESNIDFRTGTTSDKKAYTSNGEYIVGVDVNSMYYEGTILVPKPFILDSTTTINTAADLKAHLETTPTDLTLSYTVPGTSTVRTKNVVTTTGNLDVTDEGSSYFKIKAIIPIAEASPPSSTEVTGLRDTTLNYRLALKMNGTTVQSPTFTIRLVDGSAMYIADVNYMSGYKSSLVTQGSVANTIETNSPNTFLSMESSNIPTIDATPINSIDVHSIPFMVELYIGQYNDSMTATQLIDNLNISNLAIKVLTDSSGAVIKQSVAGTNYTRVFIEVSKLKITGKNTIDFNFKTLTGGTSTLKFNTEPKRYNFNLMTGPYVRFNGLENGENIPYNSDRDKVYDVFEKIGFLQGSLFNLINTDEIRYAKVGNASQTVYLFVNNVEIPLEAASDGITSFIPKGLEVNAAGEVTGYKSNDADATKLKELISIINLGGTNTVKLSLLSKSYNFTTTYTFTVEPKNLPRIPALNGGSGSIYPYENFTQWPPVHSTADFAKTGSTYTSRKASANIIGTFDMYDLSSTRLITTATDIQNVIDNDLSNLANYKIVVTSPEWSTPFVWNIGNEFYVSDGEMKLYSNDTLTGTTDDFDGAIKINPGNKASSPQTGDVRVIYNKKDNYFYFNIINQRMPKDNSPLVFVSTVYNAGDGGPRASYRMEINPIAVPYTIESPKQESRITNANYVEVIITSPGAESVTINKQAAEQIKYIHYNDSQTGTEVDAFRVLVKDLKANKETNIPFTITRAGVTTTGTIPVKYVPTNIPGAEYLETMKASHKVFEGALTLSFPKNTNLIRSNYNANNDYSTQVYNSHNILFSIANNIDGIVNRHLFDTTVADYNVESTRDGQDIITNKFLDYAGRFIKASPVFWIDAGLADNPNTTTYDPYTSGLDPFPYPNRPGIGNLGVSDRKILSNREIVPSKPGSLTLQFDNSIVASAGTTVTVFHYDPVLQRWDNVGGVVDTKKGTVTVPFNKFGYYVVAKLTRSYNDVTFHSYARDAMETIYAKGIMNAVNNAVQFGGDEYVTRGEFARMIVRALDLPLNYSGTLHFNYYPETLNNESVAQSLYDYRHIETAARAGIVNGTAPGFFDETAQLQRKDAAVILARALELKLETNATKAKSEAAKAFQDAADIDYYAVPSINAIQKKAFIKGVPINPANLKEGYVFQPNARLLRSDAAIIIARVLTDQKKLPQLYL